MALSGTLETFSLPDVLRLLSSTKKTGLLTLEGDRGIGRVWVDEGEIVAADSDRASGEVDGVVFDLLRFEDGSFEFDTGAEPSEGGETRRDVDGALEAAGALLEEWREIESVVPSLDVWVRLVPEIDDDVTVGTDQWRVLAHIGTGASGHRIAGELDQGELDVCRQLKDLIDRGLVEIDDDVPAESDSTGERARSELPAFQPPAFAASTIGSADWTPPEPLGPDAVTEDPWGPDVDADLEEPAPPAEPETAIDDEGPLQDEADLAELTVEVPVDEGDADDADDAELDQLDPLRGFGADDGTGDVELAGLDDDDHAEDDEEIGATGDVEQLEEPAQVEDEVEDDADDFLSQLAHLSPKAAAAIEATANEDASGSGTDPHAGLVAPATDASGDEAAADDDDINQNLLLRFLSSTKQ